MGSIETLLQEIGAGLSKPQFKNFSSYIRGIMKSKGRKTVVNINDESDSGKDQSQLNRFLNESRWDAVKMQEIYEADVVKRAIETSKDYLFLIFDDTLKKSSVKNKVDGIAKYFDHVEKRFVWGHKVFTSCIANDNEFSAPYKGQVFLSRQYCKSQGIRYKKLTYMPFDLIYQFGLIDSGDKHKVALFDIGYANKRTLNRLIKTDLDFVTKVKSNKKFVYKGELKRTENLNRTLRICNEVKIKDAVYEYSEPIEVVWPKVGTLYLTKTKLKGAKEVQYLVTNMKISGEEVLQLYSYRWLIEPMHKDLKQNFGLGDYMIRDMEAIKKHMLLSWITCGIASFIRYNFIGEYIGKLSDKLFVKVKKFFTLGKMCRLVRKGMGLVQTVITTVGIKFMVSKNAKL
jgi:hypothetical protein